MQDRRELIENGFIFLSEQRKISVNNFLLRPFRTKVINGKQLAEKQQPTHWREQNKQNICITIFPGQLMSFSHLYFLFNAIWKWMHWTNTFFAYFHSVIFSTFFSSFGRAVQRVIWSLVGLSCFDNHLILYFSAVECLLYSLVSVKKLKHNVCVSRNINCKHILFILQCVNEEKIALKRKAVFSSIKKNETSNVLIIPVLIWYRALSIHQDSTLLV